MDSIRKFFEEEVIRNMVSETMRIDLGLEPEEDIVEVSTKGLMALFNDIENVLKGKKSGDKDAAFDVFTIMMRALTISTIIIAVQAKKGKTL